MKIKFIFTILGFQAGGEDPYYSGYTARVTDFTAKTKRERSRTNNSSNSNSSGAATNNKETARLVKWRKGCAFDMALFWYCVSRR